jgi:hypothetical protein
MSLNTTAATVRTSNTVAFLHQDVPAAYNLLGVACGATGGSVQYAGFVGGTLLHNTHTAALQMGIVR